MTRAVGFVGLGNMGRAMAQNVLEAGHALHVFNRTAAKAEALLAQGAVWASSPRALAERTGLVITMLADDDALRAVTLGEHGILAGLPPDGIHIDMSTVFPDTSKILAQLYRERGAHFVAAPVSGRPEQAVAAQLFIYLAGPAGIRERCWPVITTMGQQVIVVGDEPHLANVMKLVANFMVIAVDEALSEALTLAEKAGLEIESVLQMLQALFPSWVVQVYAQRIAASDFYSPGFNVRLGLKDVRHMRRLADQVAAPLPVAEVAYRHLLAALARGRGDLDATALVTVVRELAGLLPGTR